MRLQYRDGPLNEIVPLVRNRSEPKATPAAEQNQTLWFAIQGVRNIWLQSLDVGVPDPVLSDQGAGQSQAAQRVTFVLPIS